MNTIVTILILIVCVLLIIVVLIQNSKGGGLATGSGGNQVMGVKRTTDFLEKTTWTLAIALVSLALLSKITSTKDVATEATDTELRDKIENIQVPAAPAANQTAPATTTAKPDSGKK